MNRKVEHFIYEHSLWLGSEILVLGLFLDIYFIPTTFQRFGAVIVGYAVLHNILVSRLQKTTMAQQHALVLLNSKSFLKDLPNSFDLSTMSDEENSKAVARLTEAVNYLGRQSNNKDLSPTELITKAVMLIKAGIETKKANVKDTVSLAVASWNETVLAVLGTLIWAVGDWFTNFFWHCNFEFMC